MSFIGDLFTGGTKKSTVTQTAPATFAPGYSFRSNAGGAFGAFSPAGSTVDVTSAIPANYAKFGRLTDSALGRTGGMIKDLRSNANPFIQARVRPLQQNINERRMDLSRSMSQRGVQGSLANNELIKFDTAAQQQLADQRALATQDTLSALYQAEGLDQSVRGEVLTLADNYLKQDLAKLGLSLEGMKLALSGSQRQTSGGSQVSRESGGSDFGSVLSGIGSIVGAF